MKFTEENIDRISESGYRFSLSYSMIILVFKSQTNEIHNGTGVFIQTKLGFAFATAGHVIQKYLEFGDLGRIQIGGNGYVLKSIPNESIKINKKNDFGLIFLPDEHFKKNKDWNILPIENISFNPPRVMDLVVFSGYPGTMRKKHNKLISQGKFSLIGTIESAEYDQFSIRVDKKKYDFDDMKDNLKNAGGLSGSPIFSLLYFQNWYERKPYLIGWLKEGKCWDDENQKYYATNMEALESLLK
ncbi:hypothetical protein [Aquimarina sp. AU58]|uniref:hypothetical protein n=1 Tax=Aquimarina sp. AU58 TaxID=1874112 RepID=UPI000D6E5A3F|nr:hypothetical protein [Aquimarina sp. AU58]